MCPLGIQTRHVPEGHDDALLLRQSTGVQLLAHEIGYFTRQFDRLLRLDELWLKGAPRIAELCGIRVECPCRANEFRKVRLIALTFDDEPLEVVRLPKRTVVCRQESLESFLACLLSVIYGMIGQCGGAA